MKVLSMVSTKSKKIWAFVLYVLCFIIAIIWTVRPNELFLYLQIILLYSITILYNLIINDFERRSVR